MQDTIAQRKARAIEKLTNDRDAAIARAAQLEAERDEQQQRADILDRACTNALNERDTAWTELRVIRKTIGADDNEATSDEVSRLFGKLTTERDELRRKLEQAFNDVTDDVTRLSWLQSLITEANRHIEVLSDGDLDAGYTCLREVQALHDALKSMLNGGAA